MRLLAFLGLLLFCVPGHAEQFASATHEGETIELHDRLHGKCPPGIREARYVWADGKHLDGCWKYVSDKDAIFVVFEDGDAFLVKVDRFTWKRGRKPVST